ncbi:MAG: Protein-export membrane protein SecG [Candidatus Celerinatantimonas neptuna]|nr:MAG: Protein-export membrane protein SecG [Candidatus Celerinatantimonas neptuna]
MYNILLGVYLLVALILVGLVLIQQGKGADMGASFGSGASNTVFGSGGSGNFLTRSTAVLATLFFVISLALGHISAHHSGNSNEWQNLSVKHTNVQKVPAKVTEKKAPVKQSTNPDEQVPE